MKTLLLTSPKGVVTPAEVDTLFPEKPAGWRFEIDPEKPHRRSESADAIMVRVGEEPAGRHFKTWIHQLAQRQTQSTREPYVVFVFPAKTSTGGSGSRIASVVTDIRSCLKEFRNPDRVDVAVEEDGPGLAAKLHLIEAKLNMAPRPSPLDHVHEAVKATEDLRAASGKLSATAVADAFGISLNQLALWLGRTRQALSKTPDADSIQDDLAFYERVARLRAVVSPERFLKWLRIPNAQLDGRTPLELLAGGHRQAVADFVDDMLTGAPS